MDSISLRGVSAQGTHGVLDFEHKEAQTFSVDAQLFLDLSKAGGSDALTDTVDYGQIAARIVSVIEGPHFDLIEALAAHIADSILQTSAIRRVIVTVHKPQAPITVPFDDVAVTIERDRLPASGSERFADADASARDVGAVSAAGAMRAAGALPAAPISHRVVVAMGGNLGDPEAAMRSAVVSMDGIPGNQIMGISPLYRTTPWGMEEGTPSFLNAVVELSTTMEPMELLKALQMIESAHGRSREVHWGSRPLDLDIIDFDGMVSSNPALTLPHPRAWQRAFVLAPLVDLLPNMVLPGEHGGAVAQLLEACPDKGAVQRVSDDWILGSAGFEGGPEAGDGNGNGNGNEEGSRP
jgi:dihydroneopterin aldolase/2-amino-4-hydroxy-6-hydroxymethyldihydropteridine diphosphokinase